MQIVIDIPEEVYERFGYEYREENLISKCTNDIILDAFCDGKPLPKGHGRLIDADDVNNHAPQPKMGRWISLDDFRGKYNEKGFKCSECDEHSDYEENFCPNCGAKMHEAQERSDKE